ncbi:MAG: hypothetical protein WAL15_04070 [Xanthobacteraceae bacterium]
MTASVERKDEPVSDATWRRFVLTFLAVLLGGLAVLFALIIVIDPYDTGRFPTFMPVGVSDENQQTASASNGRNPIFDAAVFGNSHGMLLSPARLDKLTGLSFVQMTSPGSGPREQMILMSWFMRHHTQIKAFVITADQTWCTHDPAIPMLYQFPPWLYAESHLEYLAHMLNTRSLNTAYRRVLIALGYVKPTNPDGYWDYELDRTWSFRPERPAGGTLAPILSSDINRSFPALDALDAILAKLARDTPVIVVMPPQFYTLLAPPGSHEAAEFAACKADIAARVRSRERSGFFDYLNDTPAARNPENFMDPEHYRADIAREIEADIAGVIAGESPRPARALAR